MGVVRVCAFDYVPSFKAASRTEAAAELAGWHEVVNPAIL